MSVEDESHGRIWSNGAARGLGRPMGGPGDNIKKYTTILLLTLTRRRGRVSARIGGVVAGQESS